MTDTVDLREIASAIRRLWWIPLVLALVGVTTGLTAYDRVPSIYRSQATVLVGPTDGAVTQSSTVRTSEDLAKFYADLARRQIILDPVTRHLGLQDSWSELRDRVSAVVPKENLRLVTVTVLGSSQQNTNMIANEIVDQLVSLSPALPGGNSQAFINEQADNLKRTIQENQTRVDELTQKAAAAADPAEEKSLQDQADKQQQRLTDLQRVYVELIAAEPTADAGGLQVLDEASPVTGLGRSGVIKQALLGGVGGACVGLVLVWLVYRRRRGSRAESSEPQPAPAAGASSRAATAPVVAPQPRHEQDLHAAVAPRHGSLPVARNGSRVSVDRQAEPDWRFGTAPED